MKISLGVVALLAVGACHDMDDGASCKLGAAYIGEIDLTRSYSTTASPIPGAPSVIFGGLAVYSPSADAGPVRQPNFLGFAEGYPTFLADCSATPGSGQCCYVPPPPDAGDASSGEAGAGLSDWNVTATNETDPDAGGSSSWELTADGGLPFPGDGTEPPGSLTVWDWSGGDELLVQGDGTGAVGTFSGQLTTPHDFEGLNPALFSDGGTVPLGEDLALTWTPAGASGVTINALDEMTSGLVICSVPDNGSFKIPSSALSHFQPGDEGGLAIFRSAQSCAYSKDAAISIQAQTQTFVRVTFE